MLSLGFGANSKSAGCFLNDDPQVKAEVPCRIAAVGFGTVRMRIAITDPQQKIASPLEQYVRRGQSRDSQYFRELADREGIQGFREPRGSKQGNQRIPGASHGPGGHFEALGGAIGAIHPMTGE